MTDQSYIVGTVREIRGTNVIIRLFDNSSQMTYFFNGKRYSGVMIGSYIGIKRGHYTIVVKMFFTIQWYRNFQKIGSLGRWKLK